MDTMQNPGPQSQPQEKKSFGPMIGIIVIIVLLILGAFYVWGGKVSTSETADIAAPATDDASSIEAELESIESADLDLSDIEQDLETL